MKIEIILMNYFCLGNFAMGHHIKLVSAVGHLKNRYLS
jgi:hypothetical protein